MDSIYRIEQKEKEYCLQPMQSQVLQRRHPSLYSMFAGAATLFVSCSTATERLNYYLPSKNLIIDLRGGSLKDDDGGFSSDVTSNKNRRRFWKIFELDAKTKEYALSEDKDIPPRNGRGGALAITKESPKKTLHQQFRIEGGAPILLIKDSTEKTEINIEPSDTSSFWWNQAWNEATSNVPFDKDDKLKNSNINEKAENFKSKEVVEEKNIKSEAMKVKERKVITIQKVKTIQKEEDDNISESLSVQESGALGEEIVLEQGREKEDNMSDIAVGQSPHISSGYWRGIDGIASLGLSYGVPQLRLSRHLRPMRKAAAKATGLSGFLSGKQRTLIEAQEEEVKLNEEELKRVRRSIAAIDRVRKRIELKKAEEAALEKPRVRRRRERRQKKDLLKTVESSTKTKIVESSTKTKTVESPTKTKTVESPTNTKIVESATKTKNVESSTKTLRENDFKKAESTKEDLELQERKARVEEIDKLITEGQQKLQELVCEKDSLQRRPNPLYNYTASLSENGGDVKFSREFNFPSDTLVDDYLDDMFATGRLVRMNHTHLWQNGGGHDDDDDESIGDDLLTPSGNAEKLYREEHFEELRKGGGGSWLLRQSIGRSGSLGMKLGEITEETGYKSVCKSVMASLAQLISTFHGINVLTHSDIRLYIEKAPDLPPIRRNSLPQGNYAQEAIKSAIFRGSRGKKNQKMSRESFIQRDAVVETLLSHVQISAPLLKLFPLAWQRALLANMITLITQVVSDFFDGIELQFLGHSLQFSFKPISESDIIRHIGLAGKGLNHRRAKPAEFEAAVKATAEDVGKSLQFLDRWYERAFRGMLRAQIANLIARLVLTLTDEVLCDARMDLWAAQAGGPRVVTGLEYRTKIP